MQEAVDPAVAVRADLDDPAQIAALSERCEADTRALVNDVCRRQADQALAAFTAREVAERRAPGECAQPAAAERGSRCRGGVRHGAAPPPARASARKIQDEGAQGHEMIAS
jgi:hypothetical protein